MARAQDPDSGSSQFFIMHQDAPSLDGDYAAFGKVSEGMDVVDAIVSKAVVIDNNGSVEKANQPIIESIKVID
ncbi:MAG: peptidylprolyl isomerase, partial [Erysipelotrichaceae bacterium]